MINKYAQAQEQKTTTINQFYNDEQINAIVETAVDNYPNDDKILAIYPDGSTKLIPYDKYALNGHPGFKLELHLCNQLWYDLWVTAEEYGEKGRDPSYEELREFFSDKLYYQAKNLSDLIKENSLEIKLGPIDSQGVVFRTRKEAILVPLNTNHDYYRAYITNRKQPLPFDAKLIHTFELKDFKHTLNEDTDWLWAYNDQEKITLFEDSHYYRIFKDTKDRFYIQISLS